MMIVELVRLEEDTEAGTLGILKINKQIFCATLEPADRLNAGNVSCIPVQQYICRRRVSPKFGETFEVEDVPGRSNILFHAGNWAANTLGCILIGSHHDKLRGDRGVLNSGETFKKFMGKMEGTEKFHLTISTHY